MEFNILLRITMAVYRFSMALMCASSNILCCNEILNVQSDRHSKLITVFVYDLYV